MGHLFSAWLFDCIEVALDELNNTSYFSSFPKPSELPTQGLSVKAVKKGRRHDCIAFFC